jgi:arylsulfatase A-like enzyme
MIVSPDQKTSVVCHVLKLVLLAASLFSGAPECTAADRSPDHPNILFIFTDDQRPDTIRALGNPIIETPALDALVREGTTFTRAVSPNPICYPSRAEVLSGCSGFRNGVGPLDAGSRLKPELVTWPRALLNAGYNTWYVGKWHLAGKPTEHGFGETRGLFAGGGGKFAQDEKDWKGRPITGYRGWIFQDDAGNKFPEKGVGLTANISAAFADAAIDFINRKHDKPFFLHVSFTAPHDPLVMPPGYSGKYAAAKMPLPANFLAEHPFDHGNARGRDELLWPFPRTPEDAREERAYYYAVISHMDAQIGRMLKALDGAGIAENTIVIFSSDQGLAIGSHGLRGKQNMYEHTIGVPLIMRGPGIPRGEKRTAQVYLRDVYPTVCELAGVPIPKTVEATSFAPVLRGDADNHHAHIFGYFRDSQRMVRGDRWKLIVYPQAGRRQLFNVVDDPQELSDLSADPAQAGTIRRLQAELADWQRRVGDTVNLVPGANE